MAEKYPGLLVSDGDKQQALYRSLLDMGANMTRGYTKTPTTPFQSIAEGVAVGGNRYQQEIDRSKKAQIGDINYRMQQAQMEAEKMKIEKAKRQQAEAARKKLITDRFRAQQQYGGFEPGSMDAANYQSGLSPEQQMLNELNPVEQAKSGISAKAALAKERRVNTQQENMERIKAGSKDNRDAIQKRYDRAKADGSFSGTLVDYMTTESMAKLGMVRTPKDGGGQTFSPAKGSPAAIEADALTKAATSKKGAAQYEASLMLDEVNRSFDILDKAKNDLTPVTGRLGQGFSFIGGESKKLGALLETIRAGAGFGRLQEMRDGSVTGGALGAINTQEMKLLQNVAGNLDQSQNDEELAYNLARFHNKFLDVIHGKGRGPARKDPAVERAKYMDNSKEEDDLIKKWTD